MWENVVSLVILVLACLILTLSLVIFGAGINRQMWKLYYEAKNRQIYKKPGSSNSSLEEGRASIVRSPSEGCPPPSLWQAAPTTTTTTATTTTTGNSQSAQQAEKIPLLGTVSEQYGTNGNPQSPTTPTPKDNTTNGHTTTTTHSLSAPSPSNSSSPSQSPLSSGRTDCMVITRLWVDDVGDSHFSDVEVPLHSGGPIGWLSDKYPVGHLTFRYTSGGYDYNWHTAPAKQYIVMLDGGVVITTSDYETRTFTGGDILLVEDTTGKGHYSRALKNLPRRSLFITVKE